MAYFVLKVFKEAQKVAAVYASKYYTRYINHLKQSLAAAIAAAAVVVCVPTQLNCVFCARARSFSVPSSEVIM